MSTLVQLYVLHHSNKHLQKRAQSPIKCTFCKVEHRSERSSFVTDPVPRKEYVEDFTLRYPLRFEICAREICEKFVHKYSETIEHVEN